MKSVHTLVANRAPIEDAVEFSTQRNRIRVPSQSTRIAGYGVIFGLLAGPAGYGIAFQVCENSQVAAADRIEPRSVNVLESPPNSLRVPKLVGRIVSEVEIVCAHYAYDLFPSGDDEPGFKATDYRVYDNATRAAGFVGAEDVRPDGPVPSCNETVEYRKWMVKNIPGIENATSPVHGVVVE